MLPQQTKKGNAMLLFYTGVGSARWKIKPHDPHYSLIQTIKGLLSQLLPDKVVLGWLACSPAMVWRKSSVRMGQQGLECRLPWPQTRKGPQGCLSNSALVDMLNHI